MNVQLIKKEEYSTVLDSVATAYENYPLFNYLVEDNSKAAPIKQILAASVKASPHDVIGLSFGEQAQAVALFIKPRYKGSPAIPFLLSGGIKLIFKHSPSILFRLLHYEKYAMKMKAKHADGNCWYLYSLTVHPDCQRQGFASKVMKPMLDFFDATGQSCYLETNKLCNVAMYEHFGFRLVETGAIPKTDVIHYAMRRDPVLPDEQR